MKTKISIIGAGFVGSATAHFLADRGLGDIVLLDINEGAAKGKALDLSEAAPVFGWEAHIFGTANYEDIANSDVVIMTAGLPRKPGMSRDELLAVNGKIVKDAAAHIKEKSPKAIVIVVTNPLDAMVYAMWKTTGFDPRRVMGMAGVLDSARMRYFIAHEVGCSVRDVEAVVLGGHGDTMVPLMRLATVRGEPVSKFLSKEKINAIISRTQNGGAEIVELLKTGSAYYAPAASIALMVEAIFKNTKAVLPCAAYLNGEYSVTGLFIGVPAVLGKNGVEKIIEIEFTEEEKTAFQKTVEHVASLRRA